MKIPESPYAKLSTDALWTMRDGMEEGVARTGEQFAAGEPLGEGALDMLKLRVIQVEAIDAVLLFRGEKVDPPFWE